MEKPEAFSLFQILKKDVTEDPFDSFGDHRSTNLQQKSKSKSRRSLFTTLIRRKIKTSRSEITKKSRTFSKFKVDINGGPSSSQNEGRFISGNLQSEEVIHIAEFPTDSDNPSSSSSKSYTDSFVKKIFGLSRSSDKKAESQHSKEEEISTDETISDKHEDSDISVDDSTEFPTRFVPMLPKKYVKGFSELANLLRNLDNGKKHLVQIITQYIQNQSFKKQLLLISSEYFQSLQNFKSEATTLANNMWNEQIQITKYHELTLQKKLYNLVKQNRTLQLEVANLCKLCEKLAQKGVLRPKSILKRQFRKSLPQHLLSKNKSLQKRIVLMVHVIEQFEDELNRLQIENDNLEQENRNSNGQIVDLRALLERMEIDCQLQRSCLSHQLNQHGQIIKESESATKILIDDVNSLKGQLSNLPYVLNWPQTNQDNYPPAIIYQCRNLIQDLAKALSAAHNDSTVLSKDIHQMRETNSKLQENLQKSTNELNVLSKKVSSSEDGPDRKYMQLKCRGLEEEIQILQKKLQQSLDNYARLNKEFEDTGAVLEKANTLMGETSNEKYCLQSQIEDLLQIIAQSKSGTAIQKLVTTEQKLKYFRDRYREVHTDNNYLEQRCAILEEDKQSLLEDQAALSEQITSLQDAVEASDSDNFLLKRELAIQQETIQSLQCERIKYLEEKGVLKTIFQHLKAEISRVQELEGTVANMSQESNRLAMIAEFNKQLGEQLKSEVEIRDHTIYELRNSVEKLNTIQIESVKDKVSLCAKLSEISVIKDKLNDSLQMEMRRNMELDESKRKVEDDTKNQMKMLEEMQKSERATLKELLRDFKSIVKHRDTLLKVQEKQEPQLCELRESLSEQQKLHQIAIKQIEDKELNIKEMTYQIEEREKRIRNLEDDLREETSKYDKHVKHIDKAMKSMRKEKEELQSSVSYLKNNSQKVHSELSEAKAKQKEALDCLASKKAELKNVTDALNRSKTEIRAVNESNYNLKKERDTIKQMYEKQSSELEELLKKYSAEHHNYAEETNEYRNILQAKEKEINSLKTTINEENRKLTQLEQDCHHWKCLNEEKSKLFDHFEGEIIRLQDIENQKLAMEEQLHTLQNQYHSENHSLQEAKKEILKLSDQLELVMAKNEEEKLMIKDQTEEFFSEYTEQKSNIEDEINNISHELNEVTQNLQSERIRYEQLNQAYDEVLVKLEKTKHALDQESASHQDTSRKMAEAEKIINNLEMEREDLQRQVHNLFVDLNEEKDANIHLSRLNEDINFALDDCRTQNTGMLTRFMLIENKFRETKHQLEDTYKSLEDKSEELQEMKAIFSDQTKELDTARDIIEDLKRELDKHISDINEMKEENFKVEQEATSLQFMNCELTLQLHEIQGKLETQKSLYAEMKTENEKNLNEILKIHEAAMVTPSDCGDLYCPDL